MNRKSRSWTTVVLWMVFFWPVGIFLLIGKLTNDRSAVMNINTRPLTVIAWILIGLGTIGALGFIFDPTVDGVGGSIVGLAFVVGGLFLLKKVKSAYSTGILYKNFLNSIVNHNVTSLDEIAAANSSSYDDVKSTINKMINSGYIKDAYVHDANREIIIKHHEKVSDNSFASDHEPHATVIRCSGCGANNSLIKGEVSECEYCGSPITAK